MTLPGLLVELELGVVGVDADAEPAELGDHPDHLVGLGVPAGTRRSARISPSTRSMRSILATTTEPSWPSLVAFCQVSGSGRSRVVSAFVGEPASVAGPLALGCEDPVPGHGGGNLGRHLRR